MQEDSIGVILGKLQLAIAELDKRLGDSGRRRNVSQEVYDCSRGQMGWFTSRDIDTELGLFGKQIHSRRQQMHVMVQKGLLERHPTRRATFRNVGDN